MNTVTYGMLQRLCVTALESCVCVCVCVRVRVCVCVCARDVFVFSLCVVYSNYKHNESVCI